MKARFSRNDILTASFALVVVALVAFAAFRCKPEVDWIGTAILGVTALIVLWYTRETGAMKEEMIRQSRLQTRPVLTLVLGGGSPPLLKNEGKGPALNSSVTSWSVQSALNQSRSEDETYEIPITPYISPDSVRELRMFRIDRRTGAKGTVSEPDVLTTLGKVVAMTVRYEDIEGTPYVSKFQVRSGRLEWMAFSDKGLQINKTA